MAANILFLEEQIVIRDSKSLLTAYEDRNTGSGGSLTRYFCSQCGSSMLIKPRKLPGMPSLTVLLSGTVDDLDEKEKREVSRWVPKAELFCAAGKREWFPRVTSVAENMCFDKMMPREVVASIFQNVQTQK
jgi:hypothetical protein